MSSAPEPAWRIQNNGQEYGPYARARILEMLAGGELPQTAAIRQEGMPDWLPVPDAIRLLETFQAPVEPEPSGSVHSEMEADVQEDAVSEFEEESAAMEAMLATGPVACAAALAPEGSAPPEPAQPARRRRSKAPWVYAAVALLALAAAWWFFRDGDAAGPAGYATVKQELVRRMEIWREQGHRLESVPASAVDGPLVRYRIDPPAGPIGEHETAYTFVVHCTFRDLRGVESESKVTVSMGKTRVRVLDLFSK